MAIQGVRPSSNAFSASIRVGLGFRLTSQRSRMRRKTASVKVHLLSEQNAKILFIKSQVYYSEKTTVMWDCLCMNKNTSKAQINLFWTSSLSLENLGKSEMKVKAEINAQLTHLFKALEKLCNWNINLLFFTTNYSYC